MNTSHDKLSIAPLADADIDAVASLWERCGLTRPWNDPRADIAFARKDGHAEILVGKLDGAVAASVMVGHDGHRGWLYYVAVDPAQQSRGYGGVIMDAAEGWLRGRGILKAELLIRPGNTKVQKFYETIGYNVEPRTVMSKWLDGRDPTP